MIFIQYFISLLHFITSLLQHSSKIPCLSISLDLYLRHMSLSYVFFSFILPISFFFYFTLVAVCCYLSISFAFVTMLQTYFLISSASVSFALTLYWIFFLSFLCLSQRIPRIVSSVFYVLAVCFMRRWNLFVNPILWYVHVLATDFLFFFPCLLLFSSTCVCVCVKPIQMGAYTMISYRKGKQRSSTLVSDIMLSPIKYSRWTPSYQSNITYCKMT